MSRFLTVEQTAEILQLSPDVVRQYLREGKIPGRKFGRHWRVLEEDLIGGTTARESAPVYPKTIEGEQPGKLRAANVLGKFARPERTVDDFLREKQEEIEEEERRWEERHKK